MLLNDDEIKERIESPLNLLNRLRTTLNKTISGNHGIMSIPPKADEVITDLEDKIKDSTIRGKAKSIMKAAMDELEIRMPEVQKPERLAAIAAEMAKVVNREEKKDNNHTGGQIIVYAPQVLSLENYNIVDASE